MNAPVSLQDGAGWKVITDYELKSVIVPQPNGLLACGILLKGE